MDSRGLWSPKGSIAAFTLDSQRSILRLSRALLLKVASMGTSEADFISRMRIFCSSERILCSSSESRPESSSADCLVLGRMTSSCEGGWMRWIIEFILRTFSSMRALATALRTCALEILSLSFSSFSAFLYMSFCGPKEISVLRMDSREGSETDVDRAGLRISRVGWDLSYTCTRSELAPSLRRILCPSTSMRLSRRRDLREASEKAGATTKSGR
mmetsp:Transcript_2773/g.6384  ORF Transcript_2773/g.6384 Transcript_2773/m.6384 type:complete len:215 (-) Transcript_2773:1285-1929(-)